MVKLHSHHSQDSPSSAVGESPDQPLTLLCPLRPLKSFLIPTHGRSISKNSQTTPESPHPWIYNKHSEFQTLTFKNIFLHLNISVCWVCFLRTFAGFLMESKDTLGFMFALWALEQKIINFHSVKIRKKEEGRKGEKRRKRESYDYLAQALIQLHYWYLLSTYCMHRKITLSVSRWLLTSSPPVWLLPIRLSCVNDPLSHCLLPGDAVKIGKCVFAKFVKSSDECVM